MSWITKKMGNYFGWAFSSTVAPSPVAFAPFTESSLPSLLLRSVSEVNNRIKGLGIKHAPQQIREAQAGIMNSFGVLLPKLDALATKVHGIHLYMQSTLERRLKTLQGGSEFEPEVPPKIEADDIADIGTNFKILEAQMKQLEAVGQNTRRLVERDQVLAQILSACVGLICLSCSPLVFAEEDLILMCVPVIDPAHLTNVLQECAARATLPSAEAATNQQLENAIAEMKKLRKAAKVFIAMTEEEEHLNLTIKPLVYKLCALEQLREAAAKRAVLESL